MLRSQAVPLIADLPGRVAAYETSDVRPQVSGVLRQRNFVEGSKVRAGQVLYVIEDAPFRAAVLNAKGLLAQAQANIRSTQLQAERFNRLVAVNGVSRQDADNAEAAAEQARASVTAQRGALNSAEVNLDFTRIRAPISGRIGRSLFTPGALVQAGQSNALATIQNMDRVYVDITQSAADLLNLRAAEADGEISESGPGVARVQLVLPNGALYPIEGRMRFADVTVDPTTGAVNVRAVFPNPNGGCSRTSTCARAWFRASASRGCWPRRPASRTTNAAKPPPWSSDPATSWLSGSSRSTGGRRRLDRHRRPGARRQADRRRPAQPSSRSQGHPARLPAWELARHVALLH